MWPCFKYVFKCFSLWQKQFPMKTVDSRFTACWVFTFQHRQWNLINPHGVEVQGEDSVGQIKPKPTATTDRRTKRFNGGYN